MLSLQVMHKTEGSYNMCELIDIRLHVGRCAQLPRLLPGYLLRDRLSISRIASVMLKLVQNMTSHSHRCCRSLQEFETEQLASECVALI